MNEDIELAKKLMNDGRSAFFNGKLVEAFEYVQKALTILENTDDLYDRELCINILGVIYQSIGDDSKGMDCYLEGLAIAKENGFETSKTLFYNNIASSYITLKEYEKSLEFCLKAEEAIKNSNDDIVDERVQIWTLVTYLNLFTVAYWTQRYKQAEFYMNQMIPLLECDDSNYYKLSFNIFVNALYWKTNRQDLTRANLPELIQMYKDDTNISDIVENTDALISLVKEMKDYDLLLEVLELYEQRIENNRTINLEIAGCEYYLDYYKMIDDKEKYLQKCIEHTELTIRQAEKDRLDKVSSIDIKIALQRIDREKKDAENLSNIDTLTSLGNRHAYRECERKTMQEDEDCLLGIGIIDIDFFKQKNDTYGHLEGDKCLQAVSSIINVLCDKNISAYRIGGDEFAVVFKHSDKCVVENFAKSLKEELDLLKVENINSRVSDYLTLSAGYAISLRKNISSLQDLARVADEMLYSVKEAGRNNYKIKMID